MNYGSTIWRTFLVSAALAVSATTSLYAIHANPHPLVVRQPDGSELEIRMHGDENLHYATTTDGYWVAQAHDGYYHYVTFDSIAQQKVFSACVAHEWTRRDASEIAYLQGVLPARRLDKACFTSGKPVVRRMIQEREVLTSAGTLTTAKGALKKSKIVAGENHYLVILVNYSDLRFRFNRSNFNNWLNKEGYSTSGATGSVRDYYRDNSMGKYEPNFTVLGPYTLSQTRAYYGGNDYETGSDVNPRQMITEALQLAKAANPDLDFSQFDNNHDGIVETVNVIYAGYSEASSGDSDDMWPHTWYLGDSTVQIDGVTFNDYTCSQELVGSTGASMDGIGTFTHEFGHAIGLYDMYDTDSYTNGYAIDPGDYSLFSSGSYNNNSRTPPYLMAFERQQMGWLDIEELSGAQDVVLEGLGGNYAYAINCANVDGTLPAGVVTKDSRGEWYLFENRQQEGWDKYIPAHGLMITHYDYTQAKIDECWSQNAPNSNAKHRCLYVVCADGLDDGNTKKGDVYPGTSGNTEFSGASHPTMINWAGDTLRVPVTNIREEEGLIRFQVAGGLTPWSIISTLPIEQLRDSSVLVSAHVETAQSQITEMGFCWAINAEPSINTDHVAVDPATDVQYRIEGLTPGTRYQVRAYMQLASGEVVYGAALPFTTECKLIQAPYLGGFTSWTDGELDCWKIVDNNGDGTTWYYDSSTQGLVYSYDYWNNADDWLISCRMRVPERGALYFVRGVLDENTVETLDIYVSTKSREMSDFHLYKRFTFMDTYGEQKPEEIDLSDFAGQDIYVAFVVSSEKMMGDLWIWQIYLTQKLDTPQITQFDYVDGALNLKWDAVSGARSYYLEFNEVTDEPYSLMAYVQETDFDNLFGKVALTTGNLEFTGDGVAETRYYPDGISNLVFYMTISGPVGTSNLIVEGTEDGTNWFAIGPKIAATEFNSDGIECLLGDYMTGKTIRRLRFTCQYGGRNIRLRYLSLIYTDGLAWNELSAGTVTKNYITIGEKEPGEFQTGKTYAAVVYAGDGILYYDGSEPAYFTYSGSTGIQPIVTSDDAQVHIYTPDGRCLLPGQDYRGMAIVRAGQRTYKVFIQ